MSAILPVLDARWRDIYTRLAGGQDCPPGLRLRAEGLMEAAVLAGEASQDSLDAALASAYEQAFGHALVDDFGPGWRAFHPFPEIPGFARRAPVFPSTPE